MYAVRIRGIINLRYEKECENILCFVFSKKTYIVSNQESCCYYREYYCVFEQDDYYGTTYRHLICCKITKSFKVNFTTIYTCKIFQSLLK